MNDNYILDVLSLYEEKRHVVDGKRDEPNAIYSHRDDIDWDKIERENRRYKRIRDKKLNRHE